MDSKVSYITTPPPPPPPPPPGVGGPDMSLEHLMAKLESAAQSALDWFHSNGMKLNSSKCHLLVCGNKFECMLCEIRGSQIIETHLVKLLGVNIESYGDSM